MILGHAFPAVVEAIQQAAARGASFGASTPTEADLAERITQACPSIEKVRFVSSGTEATMSAIRVARAFTSRKYIIKFEGCYHGHADGLLVKAGSGVATLGIPGSAGVPEEIANLTIALPFNDLDAVKQAFAKYSGQIACVIVEPIVGNMGCVPPADGYLQALRSITAAEGSVLIFDEVMTGFRVAYGGAQAIYGIQPDMTTLGKIIGGGLPCGAFGGRAEIMNLLAPAGPGLPGRNSKWQSRSPWWLESRRWSTLKPNKSAVYREARSSSGRLASGCCRGGQECWNFGYDEPCRSHVYMVLYIESGDGFSSASTSDTALFGRFHREMLDAGVWLPPSQFEAAFLGTAHTDRRSGRNDQARESSIREHAKWHLKRI